MDTFRRRGTFLREGDSGEGEVGAIIGAVRMAWDRVSAACALEGSCKVKCWIVH